MATYTPPSAASTDFELVSGYTVPGATATDFSLVSDSGVINVETTCASLVISGQAASVGFSTEVYATTSTLSVTSQDTEVFFGAVVSASTATLDALGFDAQVDAFTGVQADYDELAVSTLGASVLANTSIQATLYAANLAAHAASIAIGEMVSATHAGLTVAALDAAVTALTTVEVQSYALTVNSQIQDVNARLQISLTQDSLTLTYTDVQVDARTQVSPFTSVLELTSSDVAVDALTTVDAGVGNVHAAPHAADVNNRLAVSSNTTQLSLISLVSDVNLGTDIVVDAAELNLQAVEQLAHADAQIRTGQQTAFSISTMDTTVYADTRINSSTVEMALTAGAAGVWVAVDLEVSADSETVSVIPNSAYVSAGSQISTELGALLLTGYNVSIAALPNDLYYELVERDGFIATRLTVEQFVQIVFESDATALRTYAEDANVIRQAEFDGTVARTHGFEAEI